MARITHSHLGTPSGKLGNVVYKRRNKKTFSQMATEVYNETKSEKVKKNRNLFSEVTLFSNYVNKSPTIKYIWKTTKMSKGLASNIKIFVYNYPTIKSYGISFDCRILPPFLPLSKAGIAMNENELTFSFVISYNGTLHEAYNDFKAPFIITAVIRMEDPVSEKAGYKMANMRLEEKLDEGELSKDGLTHFTFETEKKKFKMMKDFNKIIVYPAIISLDQYKQPYKWAECGGIYVKGADRVYVPPSIPEPVQKPGVYFDIEYR
jgi:hypothetical protein